MEPARLLDVIALAFRSTAGAPREEAISRECARAKPAGRRVVGAFEPPAGAHQATFLRVLRRVGVGKDVDAIVLTVTANTRATHSGWYGTVVMPTPRLC